MRAFPKGVRSMRRLLRGLVGSALIAATVITAVGAHSGRTPTAGASKGFTHDELGDLHSELRAGAPPGQQLALVRHDELVPSPRPVFLCPPHHASRDAPCGSGRRQP